MEIPGDRECRACGTTWSYFETGDIRCPDCNSPRSVGRSQARLHTASQATLDLTSVRQRVDEDPLAAVADAAAEQARTYIREVGFVNAGRLEPLDETTLAALELRRVGTTLARVMQMAEPEERYLLSLLRGAAAGDRPGPDEVPETLHPERGLAVAAGVDLYLTDVRRAVPDRSTAVDRVVGALTARRKRLEALDGAVDPTEAEHLVRGVRDLSTALREDDETALARAQERVPD